MQTKQVLGGMVWNLTQIYYLWVNIDRVVGMCVILHTQILQSLITVHHPPLYSTMGLNNARKFAGLHMLKRLCSVLTSSAPPLLQARIVISWDFDFKWRQCSQCRTFREEIQCRHRLYESAVDSTQVNRRFICTFVLMAISKPWENCSPLWTNDCVIWRKTCWRSKLTWSVWKRLKASQTILTSTLTQPPPTHTHMSSKLLSIVIQQKSKVDHAQQGRIDPSETLVNAFDALPLGFKFSLFFLKSCIRHLKW